jgi:hypothetical protein
MDVGCPMHTYSREFLWQACYLPQLVTLKVVLG